MRLDDREHARKLARALVKHSLAWARTFAVSLSRRDPGLETQLFPEILAYALSLLQLRSGTADETYSEAFVESVRQECSLLQTQWLRRQTTRHKALAEAGRAGERSRYAEHYLALSQAGDGKSDPAQERFEEFCRCTGLDSGLLVGEGENLAALIFYIVAHLVVSTNGPLSREKMTQQLRTARGCRASFETLIAQWLAGPSPQSASGDLLAEGSQPRRLPPSRKA
jgi:hypothetical protein